MAGARGRGRQTLNNSKLSYVQVARNAKANQPKQGKDYKKEGEETPYFKTYTRPCSFTMTAKDAGTGLQPFETDMVDLHSRETFQPPANWFNQFKVAYSNALSCATYHLKMEAAEMAREVSREHSML
jgi:hypothetical protein